MYSIIQAAGEARLREMHEQAARDQLIRTARRARREAAAAGAGPRRRPGLRWWPRRATAAAAAPRVPADATPDQWAAALSAPDDELVGAACREPAGGRVA